MRHWLKDNAPALKVLCCLCGGIFAVLCGYTTAKGMGISTLFAILGGVFLCHAVAPWEELL